MRLVLDTNIVIAALLWKGAPRHLFRIITEGRATCSSSEALVGELTRALQYPQFTQRISEGGLTPEILIERYNRLATLVIPADISPTVAADPDDDHVLACAVAAQVDLIVSGDAHLLNLKAYQGIPIVTAAEALTQLSRR